MKRAKRTDLAALVALDARCFERPWSPASWQTELDREWVRVWALEGAEGALTGFAVFWFLGEEAELLRIAVSPDHRHKGLGKTLLRQGLDFAKDSGCEGMSLEVEQGNQAAIALYQALGFAQVGRRPGYYAGKDGLLFSCSFGPNPQAQTSSAPDPGRTR